MQQGYDLELYGNDTGFGDFLNSTYLVQPMSYSIAAIRICLMSRDCGRRIWRLHWSSLYFSSSRQRISFSFQVEAEDDSWARVPEKKRSET